MSNGNEGRYPRVFVIILLTLIPVGAVVPVTAHRIGYRKNRTAGITLTQKTLDPFSKQRFFIFDSMTIAWDTLLPNLRPILSSGGSVPAYLKNTPLKVVGTFPALGNYSATSAWTNI